jgi:DNA polymerase III subunit delta
MAAPKPEKVLADAIKSGRFDAIYALSGGDDFRKEEALRQLLDAASDRATRDFNTDVLRGSEADSEMLEVALSALPMMAERRVVVIRDAGSLKKPVAARLERYLKNPASTTLLVLLYPEGSDVPAAVEAAAIVVPLERLSDSRLTKWIIRQAKSAHGAEITEAAATLLQEVVGNDLVELNGELDKLCSFAGDGAIDEAAVSAVVGARPGETMVGLLEAVAARDVRRALKLMSGVLRQPKVTGVQVVMSISAQFMGIGWCRARRDAGADSSNLQREGFGLARRVPQFMDPRAPGVRLSAWARASKDWGASEIDAALDAMLAADIALKQTRVASEEQIVSTAVLAACAASVRASAAA